MSPNRSVLPGLAIVLMTALAYAPVARNGYVWDDDDYVTGNPTLRTGNGLVQIWTEPLASPQYYPLTFSSFWLEYRLWGLRPLGYHLVNVLLHAVSAWVLWRILRALHLPGAWLGAAVFAVHPVHVESVAWITERKNVLSGLFYLGSALCLVRFYGVGNTGVGGASRWRLYALGGLLFVGALLSKTVTASLPAAIALVLWWKRGGVGKREAGSLAALLALGGAAGLATSWIETHHVGAGGTGFEHSPLERVLIAGRALWFYAAKLVWPSPLVFNYTRWEIDPRAWWQYLYPTGAVIVVVTLWAARHRIGRGPLAGLLFFAGTVFPALGFVDFYPMIYSYVADHFQYLASIGLIAAGTAAATRWAGGLPGGGRRIVVPVAVVLIGLLGALTWRQARIYRDPETLWQRTLEENPRSLVAHYNLGFARMAEGNVQQAMFHYTEALRAGPNYAETYICLGGLLEMQGRFAEAAERYREALRVDPNSAAAHNNLGGLLGNEGRFEEAAQHYAEAIRIDPGFAEAYNNLGVVRGRQGRFEEAVACFSEALRLDPDYTAARRNLEVTRRRRGE